MTCNQWWICLTGNMKPIGRFTCGTTNTQVLKKWLSICRLHILNIRCWLSCHAILGPRLKEILYPLFYSDIPNILKTTTHYSEANQCNYVMVSLYRNFTTCIQLNFLGRFTVMLKSKILVNTSPIPRLHPYPRKKSSLCVHARSLGKIVTIVWCQKHNIMIHAIWSMQFSWWTTELHFDFEWALLYAL